MEDVRYRPAEAADFAFLATMLGESAVWRPDKPTPSGAEVLANPRYAMYLVGWPTQGDFGLIAEQGQPLGAAWYRTYSQTSPSLGFVADDIPELSIAVIAARRHEGIGRRLLVGLIEASEARGYAALSLTVNTGNPARFLYESVGFRTVSERPNARTMVRQAGIPN